MTKSLIPRLGILAQKAMPAHMKRVHIAAFLGCIALAIVSCSAKAASPAPKAEAVDKMSPEETAMHQAAMAQAAVDGQAEKEPARNYEPTLTYLSDKDEEPHVDAEQVFNIAIQHGMMMHCLLDSQREVSGTHV